MLQIPKPNPRLHRMVGMAEAQVEEMMEEMVEGVGEGMAEMAEEVVGEMVEAAAGEVVAPQRYCMMAALLLHRPRLLGPLRPQAPTGQMPMQHLSAVVCLVLNLPVEALQGTLVDPPLHQLSHLIQLIYLNHTHFPEAQSPASSSCCSS